MINDNVPPEELQIVFGDTDTLSSFLNRGCFGIFVNLFEDMGVEVVVPKLVYDELARKGGNDGLRTKPILQLERKNKLKILDIEPCTDEMITYLALRETMGQGESAALSMAKHSDKKAGIASNNLRDIEEFARENDIEIWTTIHILEASVNRGFTTTARADDLWKKMKQDGLWLPDYESLTEYLKRDAVPKTA